MAALQAPAAAEDGARHLERTRRQAVARPEGGVYQTEVPVEKDRAVEPEGSTWQEERPGGVGEGTGPGGELVGFERLRASADTVAPTSIAQDAVAVGSAGQVMPWAAQFPPVAAALPRRAVETAPGEVATRKHLEAAEGPGRCRWAAWRARAFVRLGSGLLAPVGPAKAPLAAEQPVVAERLPQASLARQLPEAAGWKGALENRRWAASGREHLHSRGLRRRLDEPVFPVYHQDEPPLTGSLLGHASQYL